MREELVCSESTTLSPIGQELWSYEAKSHRACLWETQDLLLTELAEEDLVHKTLRDCTNQALCWEVQMCAKVIFKYMINVQQALQVSSDVEWQYNGNISIMIIKKVHTDVAHS